jgi:hypothetical protein
MTECSRWFEIHGKLSNREYSEIKNTVMFSTFAVCYWILSVIFVISCNQDIKKTEI